MHSNDFGAIDGRRGMALRTWHEVFNTNPVPTLVCLLSTG